MEGRASQVCVCVCVCVDNPISPHYYSADTLHHGRSPAVRLFTCRANTNNIMTPNYRVKASQQH